MAVADVTSFTASSVDLLVDFLDGIQVEFGSKPRRDGIVSFQELEMAFRRVRRRYMEARKTSKVRPIIEELLQAIEGNGMTLRAWFEVMDQMAINNMVTQSELASGMRMLQSHNSGRKKQPVLTDEKIQALFVYMDANHDGTLELNEIALACKVERYKTKSSERMEAVSSMMQALDDYMGVHFMKIRDLFVHLDKDKSDGLSRAEIRCGFHAIQAEAKRRQEAAARRKRHEALRKAAREREARKAEVARHNMKLLVERRRKLSAEGEATWIPAPLAGWQDPWVAEESGLLYKAAKGRTPAQALIVYFRTFMPDDGPVYGVIMHPREYFGNVTMRVTKLFKYNGGKYAGLARILYPPDGAFQAVKATSGAASSKPEIRYIETDAEWRGVLSREFACKSEERLQRIAKWRRDQLAVLSAAEEQAPSTASAVSAKEALGEVLELVSNPENLWAVTKELLVAVVSHIRAPRSESDEAPALAASILWKLSEYEDFVLPLLRADAAGACAGAVEDLGPPRAGPLSFWMQVAVQTRVVGLLCRVGCAESVSADVRLRVASAFIAVVARPWGPLESRKEFREGVERKTLSFACFALGQLVATSASIRGSIAHRSRLFDTLVSALRPRNAPTAAGGGGGGGLGPGGSPPQAVACAAFCLAHVTTGESAALITRWRILAACSTVAGLLDTCIDQVEAAAGSQAECGGAPGSGGAGPGPGPKGDARRGESAGGGSLDAMMVMETAGTALWGCMSHLTDASTEEDSVTCSIRDSSVSGGSVGSLDRGDLSVGGGDDCSSQASDCKGLPAAGAASSSSARTTVAAAGSPGNADAFGVSGGGGDGLPERPQKTTREVLSACALTLLRLLSFAAKHHMPSGSSGSSARPDKAETAAAHNNRDNNSDVVIINTNTGDNNTVQLMRPPPLSQAHPAQHLAGDGKTITDTNTNAKTKVPKDNSDIKHHSGGVPNVIIAVVGSCLAHVAQAIDLAAGPRGALESVLTLLLPPAGLLVREQAALVLGAIAGQGFQILTDLREARAASAAASSPGGGGGGGGGLLSGRDVGGALPETGEGRREGKRLLLWRLFCTGVVGGTGAQVILDCALPGPPARPNSLLLRDRAARAFSLICLCARPTPASSVVVGGVVSLLRCREGDAVGGAATAALWALCRCPENRKTFARTRVVSSLMPLCEWSRENGYESLHLYCLATLYLLSQEPENALQVSNQRGSIAKLVAWATPSRGNQGSGSATIRLASAENNAKTASCLGVVRRCLLLPEGMRALSTGLASYSLLFLVLQLLRVGPCARSVFPLTLREAQGVLFAVQDRAEYRGYCERICGSDPFSVEDTLALQLERRGPQYADLAGDSVVGLASLAVTLSSRSRLAVNGTVESVGRLLAHSIDEGGSGCDTGRTRKWRGNLDAVRNMVKLVKNLSSVPEAHGRLSSRPLLPLITRLWEHSPDETTSKLACHVLANLSRSDVRGVRNRLFKSHLAAESEAMCRKASGGTSPASDPSQQLSPASVLQVPQSPKIIAVGAATASQSNDTAISSVSSSMFRRDTGSKGGRRNAIPAKNAATLPSEESCLRDARLDAQHRLRLIPAALWGERARLANINANDGIDGEETEPTAEANLQLTFLTEGASAALTAKQRARPTATPHHRGEKSVFNISAGRKRRKNDPTATRKSTSGHHDVVNGPGEDADGSGFMLPIGASALFAQAASLKRTAVTSSVPLRWQSRVIALSSLRDSFREGATRGSPSMGRKMAIRRCRAYQRTKAKSKNSNAPRVNSDNRQEATQDTTTTTTIGVNPSPDPDLDKSRPSTAGGSFQRPLTQPTSRGDGSHGVGGEAHDRDTGTTLSARPDTNGAGHGGTGATGIISSVEVARPSTAPMHSDGKVKMRPLGQVTGGGGGVGGRGEGGAGRGERGGQDPPSVVFEPGFSRLRTRRIILDRVYRFTRHEEDVVNFGPELEAEAAGLTTSEREKPGHQHCSSRVGPDASSKPETNAFPRHSVHSAGSDRTKGTYPNDLQPWKPPMLFQFCKDPGKTGPPLAKETIILEPTSPTTHFAFKPPPHNYVDSHGKVVVEAAPEGSGGKDNDRIRLDRFQHVPGSLVCRGSLGHVKGMDGRYYHHYSSSDRMWYMPEHPGPYPAPVEPPSLEQMEIAPPEAEPPMTPVTGEVTLPSPEELPGTESPNPPPLSQHYMKTSRDACSRCHEGGQCPGQGLCPVLGVVPVESMVLLVQEPRLKDEFDDIGEPVVPADGRAWSVERSSVFAQRKRQCESKAVLNTEKVKRRRFETSFGRASKLQRFPRFVAEGNRDIIIKKTSVKQEVALVRETLWNHYNTLLSSYNYYASLDGVFGEPDSNAYQLGRDQYNSFLSDILHAREKENKTIHDEVHGVFVVVNVEEESSTAAGLANLDRRLCEQEWMECMVRIGAALYRKETNNGSVARALSRFMAELAHRLPKAALVDPDTYRKDRLYKEGLEKALTSRIEGFRALFQTYPRNNLAVKALRRRMQVPKEELLRFSLTDWEMLVEDAGLFGRLERYSVKMVFLQSRMLVADELVDRTKNCCLTPVDFLEAIVRLADAMPKTGDSWPTTEEAFEEFCSVFFCGLDAHWDGHLQVHMAGSHEDGETVLNFKTFIKKTGIARTELLPAATVDGSDAAEGDAFFDRDQADSGCAG